MIDIARQCRLESETVGSVADRQRRKMASQRRQKNESNIKDANDIIRAILTNNFDFVDKTEPALLEEPTAAPPQPRNELRAIAATTTTTDDRANHKRQLDWFDGNAALEELPSSSSSSKRRKISSSNMGSFLFEEEEEEEQQELLRSKYTAKSKTLYEMGATNETID